MMDTDVGLPDAAGLPHAKRFKADPVTSTTTPSEMDTDAFAAGAQAAAAALAGSGLESDNTARRAERTPAAAAADADVTMEPQKDKEAEAKMEQLKRKILEDKESRENKEAKLTEDPEKAAKKLKEENEARIAKEANEALLKKIAEEEAERQRVAARLAELAVPRHLLEPTTLRCDVSDVTKDALVHWKTWIREMRKRRTSLVGFLMNPKIDEYLAGSRGHDNGGESEKYWEGHLVYAEHTVSALNKGLAFAGSRVKAILNNAPVAEDGHPRVDDGDKWWTRVTEPGTVSV